MNTNSNTDKHARIYEWIKTNRVLSACSTKKVAIDPVDDAIRLVDDDDNIAVYHRNISDDVTISMRPIDDFLPFKFSTTVKGFHIYDGHLKSFNNLPKYMKILALHNCSDIPIADLNSRNIMRLGFTGITDFDVTKVDLQNNEIEALTIGGVCDDNFYDIENYNSFGNDDHYIDRMTIYAAKRIKNLPHILSINVNKLSFFQHSNEVYTEADLRRLEKIIALFRSRLRPKEYIMDCIMLLSEYDYDYEI